MCVNLRVVRSWRDWPCYVTRCRASLPDDGAADSSSRCFCALVGGQSELGDGAGAWPLPGADEARIYASGRRA